MVAKARELAAAHGWFWTRQFENEANADIHSRTTAQEILRDFGGTGPDYFVTGAGTGGTLKGVARVLRAESPATRIIVAEPENAPMLASGIAQSYQDDGTPAESHPMFRPHPVQGWSPDFIPRLTGDAIEGGLIDAIQPVSGAECAAPGPRARAAGGHLLRHLRRCDAGRGARGHQDRPEGQPDPLHGSRYRRALPLDAAVRGDRAGDGRRGTGDLELDAAGPVWRSAGKAGGGSARACRAGAARARDFVGGSDRRPEAAGGDVRARVVRILLGGAPVSQRHGRAVPLGGSRRRCDAGAAASVAKSAGNCLLEPASQRSRRSSSEACMLEALSTSSSKHDSGELEPMLRAAGVAPTGTTELVGRSYLPKWLAARPAA